MAKTSAARMGSQKGRMARPETMVMAAVAGIAGTCQRRSSSVNTAQVAPDAISSKSPRQAPG